MFTLIQTFPEYKDIFCMFLFCTTCMMGQNLIWDVNQKTNSIFEILKLGNLNFWLQKRIKKNLFIIKNGKTCYCNSIDEYRVLTVIDAVVYTVVLPKKEFDVEVFVQIRFILLYNHNIN